jgi:transcription elongation factor GreB
MCRERWEDRMSKAFTREADVEPESDGEQEPAPLPGGKNYITPQGFKTLQDELRRLKMRERPEVTNIVSWAAGNGDRSENGDYLYGKKRLREIDRRIRFLNKRLSIAEVIDPATQPKDDRVRFGATVTIRDEDDNEKTYSIVGVDEIDLSKSRISWLSPLGAALLKGAEGDVITFNSPRGPKEIEIVKVVYTPLP